MRLVHMAIAIVSMAVWGLSYVAIKEGLMDTPPLLLCCLRFLFASIPAVFFIEKPKIPWIIIAGYGVFLFALTFSLAFFSVAVGMPPGLVSILTQLQVFFTIIMMVFFFNERLQPWQIIGAVTAFLGLLVACWHIGGDVTPLGLFFSIACAFTWGIANLISKKAGKINMLALVVWGSLFAWPPLLILSFIFDGVDKITYSLQHISFTSIGAVLYMAYFATLFGFSVWSWLLSQYQTAVVAPFALLVPFFGMLSSIIFFNESLPLWKIITTALIIGGLVINLFGGRLFNLKRGVISAKNPALAQ